MTERIVKNVSASIRQKLLSLSQSQNPQRLFDDLLQSYAIECFLYRLSLSSHVNKFILKGGLMLKVWSSSEFRSTKDIDMLGKTKNEEKNIIAIIKDILAIEVKSDGLFFDLDSIKTERIAEDADYEGIRAQFLCYLDSARINMQIDIGFNDIVFPEPASSDFPSVLDTPRKLKIFCYSKESVIAEKLDTMIRHGEINSRMKDFYDVWLLACQHDFEGEKLAEAIKLTFRQRKRSIPDSIVAFSKEFAIDKQKQWTAFSKQIKNENVPKSFIEIVSAIKEFLTPFTSKSVKKRFFHIYWSAPGPWRPI
jgi:hypothetical protein